MGNNEAEKWDGENKNIFDVERRMNNFIWLQLGNHGVCLWTLEDKNWVSTDQYCNIGLMRPQWKLSHWIEWNVFD